MCSKTERIKFSGSKYGCFYFAAQFESRMFPLLFVKILCEGTNYQDYMQAVRCNFGRRNAGKVKKGREKGGKNRTKEKDLTVQLCTRCSQSISSLSETAWNVLCKCSKRFETSAT